MLSLFWLAVFCVIYAYVGYPVLITIAGLALGRETEMADILPTLTLLVSAYNEQLVIREKLENSLALDYPSDRLEIAVASESTDETNRIVESFADRGVRLWAFEERYGKAATLFRTVPKAEGEIVVFSDANGFYERDALRKLVRRFSDKRVGCVCGKLRYRDRSTVGRSESLYWRYEVFLKQQESRLHALLGANGSIFAIRKSLYDPVSHLRGDDFELPLRVRLKGCGVVFEPEAVSVEDSSETFEHEFRRKVRMIAWNMRSMFIFLGESLRAGRLFLFFQLLSHKMMRWLVPVFLLLALIANVFLLDISPLYTFSLVGQILFYLLALLGVWLDRRGSSLPWPIGLVYYFCLVNWASIRGLVRCLFARQQTVWDKVRT